MATTDLPTWWNLLDEQLLMVVRNEPVGSPMWWLLRLTAKLELERPELLKLQRYYTGDHDLPDDIPTRVQQAYRDMMRRSPTNFMRLVVDTCRERMRVQGLRIPSDTGTVADAETWNIWQANGLDSASQIAFSTALQKRRAYWSVWVDEAGAPSIEVEDPLQVIVEHEPGNRRRRAAGLKLWVDDWTGTLNANLYLPDAIYKFARTGGMWALREDVMVNPLAVVPIVPMTNRPSLGRDPDGESEIEDLLVIQDRVNENTLNRMLAGRLAAFRQKWATGLAIPRGEDGAPVDTFDSAIDRFWAAENPDTKFGSFDATPLDPYIAAHEADVQDIASLSRTPRYYFTASGQAPSGDALISAESGLVAKIVDKQTTWSDALLEVLGLARRIAGLDTPVSSTIVWADPQNPTVSQRADAAIKLVQAGLLPVPIALEQLEFTPAEIARIEQVRAQTQTAAAFVDLLRNGAV